jgi:hypothetical protein
MQTRIDLERWFAQMRRECGAEALNARINDILNSTESDVDESGSVWICNPQTGHWAGEDEIADLAERIKANA